MGSAAAGLRKLEDVWPVARELSEIMREHATDIVVAGSLRRMPRWGLCHDIDLVFHPRAEMEDVEEEEREVFPLWDLLQEVCDPEPPQWVRDREANYKRPNQRFPCIENHPISRHSGRFGNKSLFYKGIQTDLYPWYTAAQRIPLLVCRTGPYRLKGTYGPDDPGAVQNKALASRAHRFGLQMQMSAGGFFCTKPELWAANHGGVVDLSKSFDEQHYYEDLPHVLEEGQQVGWLTEQHFFAALRLPMVEPHDRDDPRWIRMIWSGEAWPYGSVWPAPLSLE